MAVSVQVTCNYHNDDFFPDDKHLERAGDLLGITQTQPKGIQRALASVWVGISICNLFQCLYCSNCA